MKIDSAFSRLHPLTLTVWFTVILSVTVLSMNPIFALISFSGAIICKLILEKSLFSIKKLIFHIVFMLAITFINPLFSHHGKTVLFFLNDLPITLEALLFGALMSVTVISTVLWCEMLSNSMTSDKIIYLFGRPFPRLAVLISLTVRFIPMIKNKHKSISDAQKAFITHEPNIPEKIKNTLEIFSALITSVLEGSIDVSDSMKARGITLKGRTSYSDFRFRPVDILITSLCTVSAPYIMIVKSSGALYFSFYPSVTPLQESITATFSYILYMILIIIPSITEVSMWRRSNLKT